MRMSVFVKQLRQAERIADRLRGGLGVDGFARDLFALEEIVDRLAPFARARAGGELLVDLDRYAGEGGGGAPAFFRDRALGLLSLVTIVQRAREDYYALDAPAQGDDADAANEAGDGGRPRSRRDLRFARSARTAYTGDEVRKVQKVMKYLYSRRAYEKLKQGRIFRRAVAEGRLWGENAIPTLSRNNLGHLRRILRPLADDERRLYEKLLALPFRLKHATFESGRQGIVLSILRDLRELPLLRREAFENMDDQAYLAWLFRVLYRVEAKCPSSFGFSGQELVKEYRKPAVDPRVLAAATGSGSDH